LSLAKEPVLSLFANARTSGLCVDLGHSGSTLTPVQDGFPLLLGMRRSPLGGRLLSEQLQARLERQGVWVPPGFLWRSAKGLAPAAASSHLIYGADAAPTPLDVARAQLARLTPSFADFHRHVRCAPVLTRRPSSPTCARRSSASATSRGATSAWCGRV
jgi:hypothetical protein